MKVPICEDCLETEDVLCDDCKQKLEEGEISEIAVELSRFLYSLTDEIPTLKDVELKKISEVSDAIVVITAKGDGPRVVGKNGEVVKKLADEFNSSIRVVEDSGDADEVIRNLLEPVEVQSINTVYKPEGTEKKVVVSKKDERRVPISTDEFKEIVKDLTGKVYSLSFE